MALLTWVLRALVALLLIRFVLRLFARRGPAGRPRTRRQTERVGGTLVRDPQCGTYIPQAKALTTGSGSSVVHFCSTDCRDAWVAAHRS